MLQATPDLLINGSGRVRGAPDDVVYGALAHFQSEEFVHRCCQPVVGHMLPLAKIDHKRLYVGAVHHGGIHTLWIFAAYLAAAFTFFFYYVVLCCLWLGKWNVYYLAVADHRSMKMGKRLTAAGACLGLNQHTVIGKRTRLQCMTLMPPLASAWAV